MTLYQCFAISLFIALFSSFTPCNTQKLFLKNLQRSVQSNEIELMQNEQKFLKEKLNQSIECDCGEFSTECYYEKGVKTCTCKDGYSQSNVGICEECQCGPGELKCSFYSSGYRKCTCKSGYAPTIETSTKNQTCERCDCGPHTLACVLDANENQLCTCEDKYSEASNATGAQFCKRCDCGFHSKTCSFDVKGHRLCTCEVGFLVMTHNGDQECETKEDATAWKIATGVISVLCAFVIILLLLALYKNSRRSV